MSEIKQNVISVEYNLFRDNEQGELIESTEGKQPLVFLSGAGQMIPDFENNVKNLKVGETFSFGIKAENAYGSRIEDAVIDIPKEGFMQDGKLVDVVVEGNVIPLQDQQGNVHQGKVVSIDNETIKMDMNHPLADQDLHFTGSVVEIREATAEEVAHGHVHGPNGHEH